MLGHRAFWTLVLAFGLAGLASCGGGTSSSSSTTPPPTTYTVTATAGTGTTISPTSAPVQAGGVATFTVGLQSGYQNLVATGCTISGTTCTTGAINANATVTLSATPIPTYTVTASVDAHMYVTPTTISGPAGSVVPVTVTTDTGVVVKSSTTTGSVVVSTPSGNSYPVTINGNGTIHFLGATSNNVYALNYLRITPEVLYADQFATTPVVITASTYGTLDHMATCYFPATFNQNLPLTYNCVPMVDSGYSGGEHLFSLSFVSGLTPALRYDNGTLDALGLDVCAYDAFGKILSSGAGNEFSSGLGMASGLELGVVSRSLAVSITQVAPDVYSTSNAINVVRAYSASEVDGYSTTMARVLTLYPDVSRVGAMFDFGRTRDGNISHGGPYNGQPISGIGLSTSTPTTTWASEIVITPSDLGLTAVLHELGHSFSNYLSNSQLPLGDSARHTTLSTLAPGQMSEENNQFLSPQPGGGFLMTQVQVNKQGECSKVFTAAGSDIVATYGTRNPVPTSSYKFPTIFVGLSEQPMTPAEMAFLNRIAVYLASNEIDNGSTVGLFPACSTPSFSIATQGTGQMTTTIPAPK